MISKLLSSRDIWSVALYKLTSQSDIFTLDNCDPVLLLSDRGLRLGKNYRQIIADPFLFAHDGKLFLFYEIKTDFGHGEIWVDEIKSDDSSFSYGCVLRENFHLSYPQVFSFNDLVFMIPETAQHGSVVIYQAIDFPIKWKMLGTLIEETLRDPSFLYENDFFYIAGTNKDNELVLYFSSALLGPYEKLSVVTVDKKNSRCGGGFVRVGNMLYRFAQDCSNGYGKDVHPLKVTEISSSGYQEASSDWKVFKTVPQWAKNGHHHFSYVKHRDYHYVAVDGYCNDYLINNFTLGVLKLFCR